MAAALVQSKFAQGEDPPVTFDSPVATGSLIEVTVSQGDGSAESASVVDNKGNTYQTDTTNLRRTGANGTWIQKFYVPNCVGGSSFQVTVTSTNPVAVSIAEYSGVAATSPLDTYAPNNGTGASVSAGPTATLAQADELITFTVGSRLSATMTSASTYTHIGVQAVSGDWGAQSAFWKAVSATTAVSASGTLSADQGGWVALIAAYKAAASVTTEQEGFAFGDDDGNEASHTLGTQDANITAALGTKTLRLLLNATGDPASVAYTLRAQKNGSGGYAAVATAAVSDVTPSPSTGTESGNDTASGSWAVATPDASAGDLLIFCISWDDSTDVTSVTAPSGPNGETLVAINATPAASASTEVRCKCWYTIATGAWSAGTLTFTPSANEQWTAAVIRIPAGEFDATTPIGASTTNASAGTSESNVTSGAFSAGASDGGGRVFCWTAADADPQTVAANWTEVVNEDRGAVSGGLFTRNAVVTDSESVASATVSTIGSDSWATVSFVVRPHVQTNEVYISASANVAAGGEATTARLTAPSGKSTSDFDAGRRWDDENGSDAVDITADDYTELEWVLTVQAPAADGDYFDFRVYAGASPLDTYALTPRWTVAASAIDGTLSVTLAAATAAAAGTVDVAGAASPTLATLTTFAAGTVDVVGTSSSTLGAATAAGAGTVDVAAAASPTLADVTASAAGTVATTGQASATLGAATLAAAGAIDIVGQSSATLGAVTSTAAGTLDVVGAAAPTLAALAGAATGTVDIAAAASITLAALVSEGEGFVGDPPLEGVLVATLEDLVGTAPGTVDVVGTSAPALEDLAAAAIGVVDIAGSVTVSLAALTASAGGAVDVTGVAAPTLGTLASTVTGTVDVAGAASPTLAPVTSAAAGAVDVVGQLGATLGTLTSSGAGAVEAKGVGAATLDALVATADGVVGTSAALDTTLGALTAAAAGSVAVSAQASPALGALTAQAAGEVAIAAAGSASLAALTLVASGGDATVVVTAIRFTGQALRQPSLTGHRVVQPSLTGAQLVMARLADPALAA